MLYDRPYMRKSFITNPKGAVDIFMVILIASFFLHSMLRLFSPYLFDFIYQYFSFSPHGILSFFLWTPLTYSLLHDGPFHLIMNLLGFYFIGKAVEDEIGTYNFWYLTIIGSISGCLFWFFFNESGEFLVGSSAIVMSCLSYYCLKNPSRPITLLLFFFLPCRIKPKWVLVGILLIDSYGFIFNELNDNSGIAHSAHLGGLAGGAFFFLYLQSGRTFPKFIFNSRKSSTFTGQFRPRKVDKSNYKINFSTTDQLQKEVDRILDKINDSGFGSLTEEEKLTLEKAKGLL